MSLLSLSYAGLAAGTLLIYMAVPARRRYLVLFGASLAYYLAAGAGVFAGAVAEAALCFGVSLAIEGQAEKGKQTAARRLLRGSAVLHVLLLAVFRGCLPGLSFLTLILMAYETDVYRRRTAAEKNPLRFGAFALFFPQAVQGPIARYDRLAPQLAAGNGAGWAQVCEGLGRILWGLLKKLVLADRLAVFVGQVYGSYGEYAAGTVWLAVFLYTVQIYADFSGYMDIVLGTAGLFGIRLEENFRRPYLAQSFEEYWKRWHITMGAWFREYIFYPLAVNGRAITWGQKLAGRFHSDAGRRAAAVALPLAVTWLCTGLWHGSSVHFVLWGLANGLLILWETCLSRRKTVGQPDKRFRLWAVLRTYTVVSLVRVLFRADGIAAAAGIYRQLGRFGGGAGILAAGLDAKDLAVAAVGTVLLAAVDIRKEYKAKEEKKVSGPLFFALCLLGIAVLMIFGVYGPGYHPAEFFYSRF